MQSFAGALPDQLFENLKLSLQETWHHRHSRRTLGLYLTLLWRRLDLRDAGRLDALRSALGVSSKATLPLDGIKLAELPLMELTTSDQPLSINANSSELSEVVFDHLNLSGSTFSNAVLDTCSFRGARLGEASFASSLLFECDLADADVDGADFRSLETDSSIFINDRDGIKHLTGPSVIGYLAFCGAQTDAIGDFFKWQHHSRFPIVTKIASKLLDQRNNQLLGLTQRGEAHFDPPFARAFIKLLERENWVIVDRHELVSLTDAGRHILGDLMNKQILPERIAEFLSDEQ